MTCELKIQTNKRSKNQSNIDNDNNSILLESLDNQKVYEDELYLLMIFDRVTSIF